VELLFRILSDSETEDPIVWIQPISMWRLYWKSIRLDGKQSLSLHWTMWTIEVLLSETGSSQSIELC